MHTFADPDFLCKLRPVCRVPEPITDYADATVDIAIWSNIETGLGISAGSLATLRPLLRLFRNPGSYKYSYAARASSRKPGVSRDRFPLGSLDAEYQGRFRPDPLAVTVTTVHAKGGNDTWLGATRNSSEERLTGEIQREEHGEGQMGLSVKRSFQIASSPADTWR